MTGIQPGPAPAPPPAPTPAPPMSAAEGEGEAAEPPLAVQVPAAKDPKEEAADMFMEFMQDHIGDTFGGVVSTVTNFGLFVRLNNLHIEGLIHITSLGRDYYHYDDVRMCLSGENTGQKYCVGDVVEVKVAAVNLDEKKIDLVLEGTLIESQGHKTKSKKDKGFSKKSDNSNSKPKSSKSTKKKSAKKPRPGKNARSKTKKK